MYAGLKHDGTPIYVHNTVIKVPNTQLPTYWIAMGTHVLPGPAFLYFFFCGYIRDQVYVLPLLVMLNNLQHRI